MAGYENPGYGVGSAGAEELTRRDVVDQPAGTVKGTFTAKAQEHVKMQGVIQIVLGSVCLVSQSIVIIWALHIYSCLWSAIFFIKYEPVPSDAAGIWCGALFIVTGVVGVCAAKRNTRKWVVAYMVCALLSFLLVFVVIGLTFLNISDVNTLLCTHQNALPYAFDGLMVTAAAIELIVAVWSAVLTCDAKYGCCRLPEPADYYNVMYNQSFSTTNLAMSAMEQAHAEPVSRASVDMSTRVTNSLATLN